MWICACVRVHACVHISLPKAKGGGAKHGLSWGFRQWNSISGILQRFCRVRLYTEWLRAALERGEGWCGFLRLQLNVNKQENNSHKTPGLMWPYRNDEVVTSDNNWELPTPLGVIVKQIRGSLRKEEGQSFTSLFWAPELQLMGLSDPIQEWCWTCHPLKLFCTSGPNNSLHSNYKKSVQSVRMTYG
jgi:hypothetical protein